MDTVAHPRGGVRVLTAEHRWLKWRLFVPPVFHLLADLSGFLFYPSIVLERYGGPGGSGLYLRDFFIVTSGLYLISEGNFRFHFYLERRFAREDHTLKRLTVQLLFAAVLTMAVAVTLSELLAQYGLDDVRFETTMSVLILSLMMGTFVVGTFVFQKLRASIVEAARLKKETVKAYDEALRQQTDPHFLFNSLNTLAGLIPRDSPLAVEYVHRLAEVYRYVLHSKLRTLVTLREELECAENIAFSYRLRFGENFSFTASIPEVLLDTFIPPLTLQILIENAVKHNVVSKEAPLGVQLRAEGEELVVSNNIQRKTSLEPSSGTGLHNVVKRYELAAKKKVVVRDDSETFEVRLPILLSTSEGLL